MDGLGNLLRVGRRHDEHHMARRLLERLQQRVERRHREHVDLVDDVDLVAPARRRELHAVDNLLANVVDAGAACRIELVDVGVLSRGDKPAVLARSVGVGSRAALAQKRLRKQAGSGRLTRAARAAEQVCVTYFVLLNGIFDGALDMLLAHHVLKRLGAIFAV